MKKIIATWAAIAFAATLSSCELKKEAKTNQKANTPAVKTEIPKAPEQAPANLNTPNETAPADLNNQPTPPAKQDPRMKLFQEKQEKMWKLFQEFEKNNPEFKKLQDQINAIFSSWKQPSEEDMKKVQEIDWKIRALFTPEMKSLDEELKQMWNEIFSKQNQDETPAPTQSEPVEETPVTPAETIPTPATWSWDQQVMQLK